MRVSHRETKQGNTQREIKERERENRQTNRMRVSHRETKQGNTQREIKERDIDKERANYFQTSLSYTMDNHHTE